MMTFLRNSSAYELGYRLNGVKEEMLNGSSSVKVLFHGSGYGPGKTVISLSVSLSMKLRTG